MAIKKSKEEWAREPITDANKEEIKEWRPEQALKSKHESNRHEAEAKRSYSVRMPESLFFEVKNYIDNYARRGESMNEMFVAGMRKELKERIGG